MGRRPGYDRQEALRAACALFRDRGYARVSIQDLIDATKLNRLAIYEKFGGKEGLFYAAIEFYAEVIVREELLGELLDGEPDLAALIGALETMRAINADTSVHPGCLIVNANIELDGQDERVAEAAEGILVLFDRAIRNAFAGEARRPGARTPGIDDRRVAHLVTVVQSFFAVAYISRDLADRLIGTLIDEVRALAAPVPAGAGTA